MARLVDGEQIGLAPDLARASSGHRGATHQAAAGQVPTRRTRSQDRADLGRRALAVARAVDRSENRKRAVGQPVDGGQGWSAPGQPGASPKPAEGRQGVEAVLEPRRGARSGGCRGLAGQGHVPRRDERLRPAGPGARILRASVRRGIRTACKDVNFKRGRLEVQHTIVEVDAFQIDFEPKDYEARSIPVPASLLAELAIHVEGKEAGSPVFAAARGGWLRGRVFRRGWFDAAAETIGLEGLTPHEMRHTAASLAISAGANVKAVQRMLGHASAAVTLDVSSDLFDNDLDSVSAALDAAIRIAAPGRSPSPS